MLIIIRLEPFNRDMRYNQIRHHNKEYRLIQPRLQQTSDLTTWQMSDLKCELPPLSTPPRCKISMQMSKNTFEELSISKIDRNSSKRKREGPLEQTHPEYVHILEKSPSPKSKCRPLKSANIITLVKSQTYTQNIKPSSIFQTKSEGKEGS